MKAILIHGWPGREEYFDLKVPSPSNNQWFPWLQKQFLIQGILAQTPEMPLAYEPNYEKWKETFEQFTLESDTILIGHSCGGGFLVRWLSENKVKVGKVVLVAPWIDPGLKKEIDPNFFNFQIDENLTQKTHGVGIIYSTDDYSDVVESVNIIKSKVKNLKIKKYKDKGHFVIKDMKSDTFHEILEFLKVI